MDNWIIEIAMTVGTIIVVAAGAVAGWRSWQNANETDRRAILAKAVKELVNDAEQSHAQPGSGTAKFGWVMNKLNERFPDVEWDELAGSVEAAVTAMHKEKAARSARNHTGSYIP